MPDTHATHFQCRHIFADGHRCGSKCLREENFCFYHYRSHKPRILPEQRDTLSTFDLPAFEDRSAIQAAITLVAQRIANGCLDSKRAGLLLYALQTASLNLPKAAAEPLESVAEVELDEAGAMIAPICEYAARPHEKTLEDVLLEQWHKTEDEEAARLAAKTLAELKRQAAADSFTLPALYAVAAPPTVPDDTGPQLGSSTRTLSGEGRAPRNRRTRHTASPAATSRKFRARIPLCTFVSSVSSVIRFRQGGQKQESSKQGKGKSRSSSRMTSKKGKDRSEVERCWTREKFAQD